MKLLHRRVATCLALSAAALSAQTLAEGYATADVRDLPPGTGNVLTLDPGVEVYFTGNELIRDAGANGRRTLLRFDGGVFGSFTIRASRDALLFGESATGGVWLVPLGPHAPPRRLATVAFNYDAVMLTPDHALVSAKTGGFGSPDNDLIAVDLRAGTATRVAHVPGASGPLARRGDDDRVYYATTSASFPAPPGSTDIVSWSATTLVRALGDGRVLGLADATVEVTGLDAAGSLVLDGDGDLFGTDYINTRVFEVRRGAGTATTITDLLTYAPGMPSAGGLQLLPLGDGLGRGVFEPFQPTAREFLSVHESDFFSGASRLRAVAPRRAGLTVTPGDRLGAGPFRITLQNAAAGGSTLLTLAFRGMGDELPFALPGVEQPLFWHPNQFTAFAVLPTSTDAQGTASWSLIAPQPTFPLTLSAQCAFVSADARVLGSTPPKPFTIQ